MTTNFALNEIALAIAIICFIAVEYDSKGFFTSISSFINLLMIFIVSLCIKFQFKNPNLFFISLPKNIFSVIDKYGLKFIS